MQWFLYICVCVCAVLFGVTADVIKTVPYPYALSTTYLTHLFRSEQLIHAEIQDYANALEVRLKLIRRYLDDHEDSSKGETDTDDPWQRASQAAAHPVRAYRIVRRFANEFKAITDHIGQNLESGLEDLMSVLGGPNDWPKTSDWYDGIEALLRLQYTYDLDIGQVADGVIGGTNTGVGLPTNQVYEIAEYAAQKEYFTLASDWLKLAEVRWERGNDTAVNPIALSNSIQKNIDLHNQRFDEEEGGIYMYVGKLQGSNNVTTIRQRMLDSMQGKQSGGNEVGLAWLVKQTTKHETEYYTHLGLCNGQNYQTEEERKNLYCWYETHASGYFGPINPLKMELLNEDPYLVQIYDVIGDQWIASLKEAAMPTLHRAPPSNRPKVTYRTASYAWLNDNEIPHIPISRRIELITGLHVRGDLASEDLQIASYAYGGHVALHLDSLGVNQEEVKYSVMGDRITTFLIYLNDVAHGGNTAFPALRTVVKPVKGSAVLWYTSLKNGDIDQRMLHGACPVILGHKWIATKWTNLNQNFLSRPCGLDSNT